MLDSVEAKAVRTVGLKLMDCRLKIAVDGRVFLIQILQANQRVVLQLIAVVVVGNIRIVMEISVGIVAIGGHERAVVIEGAEFASTVVIGVVIRPVHDDLDAVAVRRRHQVI